MSVMKEKVRVNHLLLKPQFFAVHLMVTTCNFPQSLCKKKSQYPDTPTIVDFGREVESLAKGKSLELHISRN